MSTWVHGQWPCTYPSVDESDSCLLTCQKSIATRVCGGARLNRLSHPPNHRANCDDQQFVDQEN
eukprot:6479821-Amphidinium_carterae.1